MRPLMLTFMDCFVGEVGCCDIARLATYAKLVVMSGCLDAVRSCSGVGPLGRLFTEFSSKHCRQRLAIMVNSDSGLESVSVSESRCSGELVCASLRR